MKRLNPLNDYLFQKLMGEKGDEEQLLSFLNAVLKRTGRDKLSSVETLEDKTLTPDIVGEKTSILDVRAITSDGTRANIEVQLRNYGNMDRRSLFYWGREYSKGIEAGKDYKDLPNVIAINIVNFEFIPVNDFHTSFHLWEDRHKDCMLTDALEIHFVDMVKYRRLQNKDFKHELLHRWLTFFDKDTPAEVLEGVVNMDTTIQKAHDKITFLANDKDTLRFYEMREMAIMDYNSGMNFARLENSKEIARNLLNEGVSIMIIAKSTGLDESTIKELQVKLNN